MTPELLNHMQSHKWDTLPADQAAVAAAEAHRNVRRMLGMTADHDAIMVPKDPAKGDMSAVWERLGKPKTADGYDLGTVKFANGDALDDGFAAFMRKTAFDLNLPKDVAAKMASNLVQFMEQQATGEAAANQQAVALERDTLAKNWGANFEANKLVAQNAARALGVDPATVQTLESTIGYSKVMELFRNIGVRIGEDKFVSGDRPGGNVMSVTDAQAQKTQLMKDPDWVRKYNAGDSAARQQMLAINTVIVGAQQRR